MSVPTEEVCNFQSSDAGKSSGLGAFCGFPIMGKTSSKLHEGDVR